MVHYSQGPLSVPVPDNTDPVALLPQTIRDMADAYNLHLGAQAWIPYAPRFESAGANPSVGTAGSGGAIQGIYSLTGGWCNLVMNVKFGTSGASFGTGNWRLGLPDDIEPADFLFQGFGMLGQCLAFDASAGVRYMGVVYPMSMSVGRGIRLGVGTTFGAFPLVSSTSPFTWAANDEIYVNASFPANYVGA